MQRLRLLGCAALGVCSLVTAHAQAAGCTFGSGPETSLQSTLNNLLGSGVVHAGNDCLNDGSDAQWTTTTGGASILLELAGNASVNEFGIYDLSDSSNRTSVFQGSDFQGNSALITLSDLGSGAWLVSISEDDETRTLELSGSAFGFYLRGPTPTDVFYSQTGLNTDGRDHMYAYAGTGTRFVSGPRNGHVFRDGDYILAWDDQAGAGADRDYQDFVVNVMNITPVPLPAAVWLLMSGMVGLVGVSRRRA